LSEKPASPSSDTPAVPSPAATVLLLRTARDGLEVLMQRRGAALSFMGGMWVFPGGRHEPADRSEALLKRVRTASDRLDSECSSADIERVIAAMKTPAGEPLAPDVALGLHVTACRETFEECGVLLASDRDGRTRFDIELNSDLEARRGRMARDAAAFGDLLLELGLYLDLPRLVYWSHWITPAAEKRRFDTRFFAAEVPATLVTGATDQESTEQRWVRPAEALAQVSRAEMAAAPPTIFTLEDLADCEAKYSGVNQLLAAERGRAVPPVCPVITRTPEGIEVRMPWDPDYLTAAGSGLARPATYPAHFTRRASRVRIDPGFALQAMDRGPAA